MDQPKNYIRSGYIAWWDIETPKAFIGKNTLKVDVMDGKLRFNYITRSQIISTSLLSIEDIFYYLPSILAHMNKQQEKEKS